MSNDIANIGFKADTADLDKAKAKLDALSSAGAKAQSGSSKVMQGFNNVKSASAQVTKELLLNAKASLAVANAELSAAKATNVVIAADVKAASAAKRKAQAYYDSLKASKAVAAAASGGGVGGSGSGGGSGTGNGGGSNVIPIRPKQPANTNNFVTGNIAAQFQDIGVTAAMGMNPLQIALQQGTQLSAILNSMERPLHGIAQGFKSVLNSISLMTIGLVALIATLIEMVNWTKVGKSILYGLADAIDYSARAAVYLAVALALIYSRTIITGIATVTWSILTMATAAVSAGIQMAAAWLMALGPIGLLIAGIASVIAVVYLFRDEVSKIFGTDVMKIIKNAANNIIGALVGAYNGVVEVWKSLPNAMGDFTIQAVNMIIKGVEDMINGSIEAINKLVDSVPDWVKGKGAGIKWRADLGKIENPYAGSGAKVGETLNKEMDKALSVDYIGKFGEKIDKFAKFASGKLRGLADGLGKDDGKGSSKKDPWEELVKGGERTIATLKAERDAVGMSAEGVSFLKHQTDLLNEAQQKNINLSPTQRAKIDELAGSMAALETETKKAQEMLNFSKDATKGFITDMRQGLREGQSVWEAFGNAVNRVIDKITDKLLDQLLDAMFEVNSAGGGGFLSSIGGGIADFFGGFFAKGGAFAGGGVQKFAKGGAFSNSVVSSPTLFKFAKGTGLMGEAGPEAIMPLKRGADGSLGVQMYGQKASNDNGGSTPIVNVNIINNSKAQVSATSSRSNNGATIDVALDEAVANNISRPNTATYQALKAMSGNQITKR